MLRLTFYLKLEVVILSGGGEPKCGEIKSTQRHRKLNSKRRNVSSVLGEVLNLPDLSFLEGTFLELFKLTFFKKYIVMKKGSFLIRWNKIELNVGCVAVSLVALASRFRLKRNAKNKNGNPDRTGIAQWQHSCFPPSHHGFDSQHSLIVSVKILDLSTAALLREWTMKKKLNS